MNFRITSFLTFSPLEKVLVFLLVATIGLRVFFAIALPITFDEAFMYLFTVSDGSWSAWTSYSEPNNHIMYSVLSALWTAPNGQTTFVFRLLTVTFSAASTLFLYKTLRLFFSRKVSLLTTLITFCLPAVVYYGFVARGYSLIFFFSIWAVWSAVHFLKSSSWTHGIQISLALALGVWAVPSQLYFFFIYTLICLPLAWRSYSKSTAIKLGIWLSLGGVIAMLLYLPPILNSGLEPIIANRFVSQPEGGVSVFDWAEHWYLSSQFYFCIPGLALLPLLSLISLRRKDKWTLKHSVISIALLLVLLIPLFHQRMPFPRTWIFIVPLWGALVIDGLLSLRPAVMGYVLTLGCCAFLFWTPTYIGRWEVGAIEAKQLYERLIEDDVQSIHVNHPYIPVLLKFHQLIHSNEIDVDASQDLDVTPSELEGIQERYDLIILNQDEYPNIPLNYCLDSCRSYRIYIGPQ